MALLKILINFKTYFSLLQLYIIIFINSSVNCELYKRIFLFKLSEITIMTNGSQIIKYLSEEFFNKFIPCQLYINNNSQTEIKYEDLFDNINSINIIRIIWDKSINTTVSMFSNCNKIIEIDLSKFDASEVISMNNMFSGCSSLSYINFSYFNTSNVNMMNSVFYYCSSLISLDLSNFDVSEVSQITNMFSYCEKLEYINFKKAQFRKGIFDTDMLLSAYEKLMVCLEKENSVFSTLTNKKKFIVIIIILIKKI